jgi:hypothetical protein
MRIEFYPSSKETEMVVPPPKPSAHYIPDWYKRAPKFSEKNIDLRKIEGHGPGIKSCMPFFDSMVSGYIQETWQDIVIDYKNDELMYNFPITPEIISVRERPSVPLDKGFYQQEFVWKTPWIPKMPKGWSLIFTSPLNHIELPFHTATGIVDADDFYHVPFGNFPFYIKYGFRGIIPAGTPMFQLIPIQRNDWKSSVHKYDHDEQRKREFFSRKTSYGAYKKLFHKKKDYS